MERNALKALLVIGLLGCAGEDGHEHDAPCFDYTSFVRDAPVVSFQADVLPHLQVSCGVASACHRNESSPDDPQGHRRPFLGPTCGTFDEAQSSCSSPATPAQIELIMAAMVGVPADQAQGMAAVDPWKPEQSFLMHKLDGTFECPDVTCAPEGCGTLMPQMAAEPLPLAIRDNIRRWIAQGAQNN